MITVAKLRTRTVKDLAAMAKKKKVAGWHSMRKDELVKALVNQARAAAARRERSKPPGSQNSVANGKAAKTPRGKAVAKKADAAKSPKTPPKKALSPAAQRRLSQIKAKLAASKNLAFENVEEGNGRTKDRVVVMVRDPYWLHVYWELTRAVVTRAKASMGQFWHGARPILRLYEVTRNGTTSSARSVSRDIPIHGGVNNWYVDVQDPPNSYQVDVGYLGAGEKFFGLATSNVVTTPQAGSAEAFDQNWAEVAKDFDRIYAMSGGYQDHGNNGDLKAVFEEQFRRPMGDPMSTKFGLGASRSGGKQRELNFEVDTELIVHGATDPGAHVTLRGEPVHLRSDGTFAVRFALPNRRHVLPIVASSGDGVEQRTIVLAVDRNTKVMEPVIRDPGQ